MVGPMPPDTLNPKYPPRTEHRPAIAVLDVTIFNPTLDPTGGSRTRGSMRSSPGSPPEIDQRMSASGEAVWRPARPPCHPAATVRAPLQTHRGVVVRSGVVEGGLLHLVNGRHADAAPPSRASDRQCQLEEGHCHTPDDRL